MQVNDHLFPVFFDQDDTDISLDPIPTDNLPHQLLLDDLFRFQKSVKNPYLPGPRDDVDHVWSEHHQFRCWEAHEADRKQQDHFYHHEWVDLITRRKLESMLDHIRPGDPVNVPVGSSSLVNAPESPEQEEEAPADDFMDLEEDDPKRLKPPPKFHRPPRDEEYVPPNNLTNPIPWDHPRDFPIFMTKNDVMLRVPVEQVNESYAELLERIGECETEDQKRQVIGEYIENHEGAKRQVNYRLQFMERIVEWVLGGEDGVGLPIEELLEVVEKEVTLASRVQKAIISLGLEEAVRPPVK
ncbi:hypothetical protein HDU67_005191 [Dinochytrium kinnereticum]|nr:hypothetical protein HDU67_005191 [Dinochytrium kinnereticum]